MKFFLVVLVLLTQGMALAAPIRYEITQEFSEGAIAIARFVGDDLDGDGWLIGSNTTSKEIAAYTIEFSGNSIVPAFFESPVPDNIPSIRLSLFPAAGSIQQGPVMLEPDEFVQRAPASPWFVDDSACSIVVGQACRAWLRMPGRGEPGDPLDFSTMAPVLSLKSTPIPIPVGSWLFVSGAIALLLVGGRNRKIDSSVLGVFMEYGTVEPVFSG